MILDLVTACLIGIKMHTYYRYALNYCLGGFRRINSLLLVLVISCVHLHAELAYRLAKPNYNSAMMTRPQLSTSITSPT